jgi:hypothetical protein
VMDSIPSRRSHSSPDEGDDRRRPGKNGAMDEKIEQTNYEQNDPDHPREDEFIDRARQRLDQALRNITETEERMARNIGRGLHPDRKTR